MIVFQHVTKRYQQGKEAVHDLNFEIQQGEMAFLTGHSGAGKTTLLKLIALLERPSAGQITVNHQQLTKLVSWQIPYFRRTIGIIFQDPNLLTDRSVFDNVAMPLIIGGYRHGEIQRRVRAALDKVSLLPKEKMLPSQLSAGEQQRVGIARAVVNKPALLLADEPTGNLDPELAGEIMRLFDQFQQVGVSVLVASHNLPLITDLHHRIITLKEGVMI